MNIKKLFLLFLIFLFGIYFSYQYGGNDNTENSLITQTSQGYFRAFSYNNSSDGGFILRANSTTTPPYIEFGTVDKSVGAVWTGALALSNEMNTDINLTGVNVTDTQNSLSSDMKIYLHNTSDVLAENENGLLIYDQGNSKQFKWHLSKGDGNYSTAGIYILSYNSTYHIYNGSGTMIATNSDFVWVEIRILANVVPANTDYYGYITFYYEYGAIKFWYHLHSAAP